MTPDFYVHVGGNDMTANFRSRLLELEVCDHEGTESDSVSITLDDRNAELAIPTKGGIIAVGLGYKETGLRDMGLYTVDEVTLKGWPREIHVKGRALEMVQGFKEHRNIGYENKTVSQIIGEIAKRHGLQPKVIGSVGQFKYNYKSQTHSDMNFLMELGYEHDAVATAKHGSLIFCKKGEGITGVCVVGFPGQIKSYTARFQDRPCHKKSRGHYWDRKKARYMREEGLGGLEPDPNQGVAPTATHELPPIHEDGKKQSKEYAQSRQNGLDRAAKNVEIEVFGDPTIMAEMIMLVVGVRAGVDGEYRIKSVTHKLDNHGYETRIHGELPGAGAGKGGGGRGGSGSGGGSGGSGLGGLEPNPNQGI